MNSKKIIHYNYGKYKGRFYLLQTERGAWQWEASGNCGEEATEQQATQAARDYILKQQSVKEN